jgi:hypothetical protein
MILFKPIIISNGLGVAKQKAIENGFDFHGKKAF